MKQFILKTQKYLLVLIGIFFIFPGFAKTGKNKKVIVLAFDGMDPRIVREMFEKGELPHFRELAEEGSFKDLWSSIPPQSPVAWSNFITGKNPGGHAIFDFIHRDPTTYLPYLSMSETIPPSKTKEIGDYIIPLTSGEVLLRREGTAFWTYLEEAGIPATIFKIPSNYPPVESGESVSGMGTPDLLGTYGTYQYFTTDPDDIPEDYSGARMKTIDLDDGVMEDFLVGPENTFLKDRPEMKVPLTVRVDPENPVARIDLPDGWFLLNLGEWSGWKTISFKPVPFLPATRGICRFFLKETHPELKLYVSPINVDPLDPALPIDYPEGFAAEIAENAGYFYTQGMPEDTKAVGNETFSVEDYYVQSQMILKERNRLLDYLLGRFEEGLFFFYYCTSDLGTHIFWHLRDPLHPAYDPQMREKLGDVIEEIYREMDQVVAKVMDRIDDDTTLIIMSDHGFSPIYKNFQLNTWLKENGYLKLNYGKETGSLLTGDIDWSRTRAYALGFNGLYINTRGREGEGIVEPGREKARLADELARKLSSVTDPETGKPVFRRVHKREEVYFGPYVEKAPDLLLGYDWGYRTGWESALGEVTDNLLTVSKEKWSGDHCGATEVVPGILFSNKKIFMNKPHLYDVSPSILAEFGLPIPEDMLGINIFSTGEKESGKWKEDLKSLDYI